MQDTPSPTPEPGNFRLTGMVGKTFSDTQVEQLYQVMVNGPKLYNHTMGEALFRDYFLPVLSGQVQDPERLQLYIDGAGGPNVGVNVVGAAGEVLFEAPPLWCTSHIKVLPDDPNAPTFTQVVENVQLLRHRSPVQAEGLFQTAMHRRLVQAHDKEYKPTAHEARWLAIFERYGVVVQEKTLLSKENNGPASQDGPHTQANGQGDIDTIGEF